MASDILAPELTVYKGKTSKKTFALNIGGSGINLSDTDVVKEVSFAIRNDPQDTTNLYLASSLGASPHVTFSGTSALVTIPPASSSLLTSGKKYWYCLKVEYVSGYIPPYPPGRVNVVEAGI